jgi:hypothetical protein
MGGKKKGKYKRYFVKMELEEPATLENAASVNRKI